MLTSWFAGRLMIVSTAGLGFIVTFLLLAHEITSLKNALLPLLVFLPVYLLLISLNMVWLARAASRVGEPAWTAMQNIATRRVVLAGGSFALGVAAALVYIHTVAK